MALSTKYITITYDAGIDTSTALAARSFNDVVASTSVLAVSYNGQRIPLRTVENVGVANSFAKYFYEVTNIGASPFTITIKANQFYRDSALNVAVPVTAYTLSSDDLFFVEYIYTV